MQLQRSFTIITLFELSNVFNDLITMAILNITCLFKVLNKISKYNT